MAEMAKAIRTHGIVAGREAESAQRRVAGTQTAEGTRGGGGDDEDEDEAGSESDSWTGGVSLANVDG